METLSTEKETKARKEHRCDFCSYKIMVNELYMKSTHVYDGSIYDWKTHKYCAKLAHKLKMYDECYYDEGVTMDDFMETVSEKYHDILIRQLPDRDTNDYGDIIRELRNVKFWDKLWFVIRHVNKLEKKNA